MTLVSLRITYAVRRSLFFVIWPIFIPPRSCVHVCRHCHKPTGISFNRRSRGGIRMICTVRRGWPSKFSSHRGRWRTVLTETWFARSFG